MAASVAMLERFQQPTAVAASPGVAMVPDGGDRSAPRHRGHCLHHSDYRPRLRTTKYNSVSAGSALSKSMRYADGWLYDRDAGGTVGHGAGTGRNRARSTFLGRDHFGGAAVTAAVAAAAAAAVAATATPATLASAEDPYDRVRRNRMAGGANTEKLDRKRDRSGSPRTPSPDYDDTGGGGRRGRVNASSSSRRSILESTVNPYDLLRQPSDDDDEIDDDVCPKRMSLKDKFMNRIQDTVFAKSKSSVGAFSSFSSNGSIKKTTVGRNGGGVNIAGHTVGKTFF